MDVAAKFDNSEVFEDEPTRERELVHPIGGELLLGLIRDVRECNDGEQRAIRVLLDKMIEGRAGKPPLDPVNDPRDWNGELRAELKDALWYLCFQAVRDGAS